MPILLMTTMNMTLSKKIRALFLYSVAVYASTFSARPVLATLENSLGGQLSKVDDSICKSVDGVCRKLQYNMDSSNARKTMDFTAGSVTQNFGQESKYQDRQQAPMEQDNQMQTGPLDQQSNQSSLRLILFVHRHGDRTPINFAEKDPFRNDPFWSLFGNGQLTNEGKARLYLLGQIIRHRYDNFLSHCVDKNIRVSRSSGSLRCIESAQVFLSSFLALDIETSHDASELVWDQPANKLASLWQPASILTTSANIDGMLNEGSQCATLDRLFEVINDGTEAKNLMKKYDKEMSVLRIEYGFVIDTFHKWFWASSFLEIERTNFFDRMNPEIMKVYDRIQDAGNEALKLLQSTATAKRLRGGLLIKDIVTMMDEKVSNASSNKKFLHYSAHDINIIILLGILNEFDRFPTRPDYGSSITFELHEDEPNSQWYVKVLYMLEVPGKTVELKLDSCDKDSQGRCTLDGFKKLVAPYRIENWSAWMKECDNNIWEADPYRIPT